jgi:hypothetical protein
MHDFESTIVFSGELTDNIVNFLCVAAVVYDYVKPITKRLVQYRPDTPDEQSRPVLRPCDDSDSFRHRVLLTYGPTGQVFNAKSNTNADGAIANGTGLNQAPSTKL